MANVKFQCSSCGTAASEGSRFCTMCGSPVISVEIEEPVATPAEEPVAENTYAYAEPTAEQYAYEEAPAEATAEEAPAAEPQVDAGFYYQNPETTEPPKKESFFKKHLKLILILGIALVAVVAVVIVLLCMLGGGSSKYVVATNDIIPLYMKEDDKTVLVDANGKTNASIDGKVSVWATSMDGEVIVVYTNDDALYVYDGELAKIAKNVSSGFMLSANGKGVLYVNKEGELVLYSVASGDSDVVSEDFSTQWCISPDGKSVLFTDKDREKLMLYTDGEASELDFEGTPYGVSDGAELIYYVNDNGVLYVVSGGQEQKLKKTNDVVFNADLSQAIFDDGKKTFVSVDGGAAKTVVSSEIDTSSVNYYGNLCTLRKESVFIAPINDFGNMYFLDEDNNLIYVDGDFNSVDIAEKVDKMGTAKNSDAVYYLIDKELFVRESYDSEAVTLAEDILSFYITSDGNSCYCVNTDKEILYIEGTSDAVEVTSKKYDSISITYDDYLLILKGDTIYSSYKGSKPETVVDDFDAATVRAGEACTYIETKKDGKGSVLYASSGVDFEVLYDDIEV